MDSTAAAAPVDSKSHRYCISSKMYLGDNTGNQIKTDFDLVCKVHFAASAENPHLVRKTKSAP